MVSGQLEIGLARVGGRGGGSALALRMSDPQQLLLLLIYAVL